MKETIKAKDIKIVITTHDGREIEIEPVSEEDLVIDSYAGKWWKPALDDILELSEVSDSSYARVINNAVYFYVHTRQSSIQEIEEIFNANAQSSYAPVLCESSLNSTGECSLVYLLGLDK